MSKEMSKEISKETSKDKIKALEMAISQIEKSFGKGAIMRLGAGEVAEGIQVIPTGSIALDMATGIGGYPRGRVVEIYGPESSGKPRLPLMQLRRHSRQAALLLLLMQNMRWIQIMQKNLA